MDTAITAAYGTMEKQIAAVILCLSLHGVSIGGVAEGAMAYKQHDYAAALEEIAPPAMAGNADAQHLLGLMYYLGQGVPRDHAQAFAWQHKAALQGLPAAQYVIGAMYYEGDAVPRDGVQAVAWLRKAAGQGFPDAQYALGLMYRYHAAGLLEDTVMAYMLWKLAAAGGHRQADQQRAVLARTMTAKQIGEAECLLRDWRRGKSLPLRSHGDGGTS